MMSNEGFRSVPGVPDGWELIEVRKVGLGDFSIDRDGKPFEWVIGESDTVWPIIRKIEQPAKYRAFANSKEAESFFDCKLRFKDSLSSGLFRVIAIGNTFVGIGVDTHTYEQAFETYVCDDGTPFGVKIDE